MRDLTGKICEIDYIGSSVRVLGKITQSRYCSARGVTHHFEFMTPFRFRTDKPDHAIIREVGDSSLTDDNMIVKVWETV
jgi:hypothetical protein